MQSNPNFSDSADAVIRLNPPVNCIRQIEILPSGRCRLTLIHGGSLTIEADNAARYGIEAVLRAHMGG